MSPWYFTFVLALVLFVGCGVRGRPEPPLKPPTLGHGKPTFKRSTEEYAFPEVPSPDASPSPTAAPGGEGGR